MDKIKASSAFIDGCVVEKDFFLFSSRLDVQPHDEYDHGLVVWYFKGKWMYQTRNWQVSSVCVMRPITAEPRRGYVALEQGTGIVGVYWPGTTASQDEALPGGESGHGIASLMDVKQIGSNLYVCGYGGKLMRRTGGKWETFNKGLKALGFGDYLEQGMALSDALNARELTQRDMHAIDGFSEQAIFCVGRVGLIFRFDGNTWVQVDSPTNVDLNCLHCAGDGFVYAAGKSGVLLQGNDKGFYALHTGVDDDFYSMTWFDGHLYVGGVKGLYRLKNNGLHYVDTKQGAFSCKALDAGDGQLLVVAERWALVFDGVNWEKIVNPDNI